MAQGHANKNGQKDLFLPILLFLGYVGLLVWFRFSLPSQEQIMEFVSVLYQQFGYLIVFLAGLIEATFLVGMYLPGSTAILLGAVLAKSGVVFLPLIILLGTLGMMIGYSLNYFLGKYGWYQLLLHFGMKTPLEHTQDKLQKYGKKAIFLGYLAPNGGAFVSTASGIAQMPFRRFLFLSAVSQLFWSSVWGIAAYTIGELFIEVFFKYAAIFVYTLLGVYVFRVILQNKAYKWF